MSPHRNRDGGHDHPWEHRRRRFFRSGELHLVLLALIARRPQHGYDLMAELEAMFAPAYIPSPGSIYPALTALESESLIEAREEGDRKIFSITETGERAFDERRTMLAAVEARTGARLHDAGAIEPALERLVARVRASAGSVDAAALAAVLEEAGSKIDSLATTKEVT